MIFHFRFFILISFLVIIQSCAFQFKEFKENPNEAVIYDKIQKLRKDGRLILASEYAKKFKKYFTKSDKLEEMDLIIADQIFSMSQWEKAESNYHDFVKTYPNSSRFTYVQKRLDKLNYERTRFHKHLDFNYYIGPQLLSTGDINKSSEASGSMRHISLSYFFKPNHGIFVGDQQFDFKADASNVTEASSRKNKNVRVDLWTVGYMHLWKISRRLNIVYGIGVGSERIIFKDKEPPHSGASLGFNQFLTIDYCTLIKDPKNNPCWSGFFPSIGIFHLYSPNGSLGGNSMKGNLIGLGLGYRI
jgi:hypothetical protein